MTVTELIKKLDELVKGDAPGLAFGLHEFSRLGRTDRIAPFLRSVIAMEDHTESLIVVFTKIPFDLGFTSEDEVYVVVESRVVKGLGLSQ